MKRKKESKFNVLLTATLVVFVCLLSFSIGVISGKGWSDRDYKVKTIEQDIHLKQALEDNAPIGDEMSDKEIELLTQKALEEAKAERPQLEKKPSQRQVASNEEQEETAKNEEPKDKTPKDKGEQKNHQKTTDSKMKPTESANLPEKMQKRKTSSLIHPTIPKPESIHYTVQVAAYKTIQEAEKHSQKLIDKGFPAFPVQALIKGQEWYRVSIGSFKNRKQAMKYEKALKKQAVVKSTFVQKIKRLKK